jgi:hypothetical protein
MPILAIISRVRKPSFRFQGAGLSLSCFRERGALKTSWLLHVYTRERVMRVAPFHAARLQQYGSADIETDYGYFTLVVTNRLTP